MKNESLEQYKKILNEHGLDPPPDILAEICENISALSKAIEMFEDRKRQNNKSLNKNNKKL
jgi:hypothetical protein